MRQRGQAVLQDQATDAELAARAGNGDLEAFELLYRRHVEAAWRMALAITPNPDDAADAVSDAFVRVFQALPDRLHAADYFLPYLLAAVRNASIDVLRRGGRQRATDPREQHDWSVLGSEPAELMVAGTDAALVARAFRSLPERWRSVLWLTEVEGIPAREVAGLLGVSANGVAQLAVRARAGLRQRYLQAHLRQAEVRGLCRDTFDRLGAYAAGGLAPRDVAKVDQHLAGCDTCRSRLAQLEDVAPGLRRAVLPLPAGLAALVLGKWQLATTASGTAAGTTATVTATTGGTTTSGSTGASAAAATATGAGAAAPVGVGLGAAAVVLPAPFVTSFASVALFVASIVGVGVVDHHVDSRGGGSPAAAVTAQGTTFRAAASPGARPAGPIEDLVAAVVAEGTRAAADIVAIAESVSGLSASLPQLATPDAGDLEAITRGEVNVDLSSVAVNADLNHGAGMCPSVRILGVEIGCLLNRPAEDPVPLTEAEAVTEEATKAADKVQQGATDAAQQIVHEAVEAGEERLPSGTPGG